MRLLILLFVITCSGIADAQPGRIAFTRVREDVFIPGGDYRLEAEIWVMADDGTLARRLTHNSSDDFGVAWSPDGQTLFFGATQFAPNTKGELQPISQRIYAMSIDGGEPKLITPPELWAQFPSWSPDGKTIAFQGSHVRDAAAREIFLMNPDGSALRQLTSNTTADARPDWSPDGKRIAFQSSRSGRSDIYVMNADGSDVTRLTESDSTSSNQAPDWSPDGGAIVFVSTRDGNPEIYVMRSDGGEQRRLTNNNVDDVDPEWSNDGRRILFDRDVAAGAKLVPQIYTMEPDGRGAAPLTALPASSSHAAWTRARR